MWNEFPSKSPCHKRLVFGKLISQELIFWHTAIQLDMDKKFIVYRDYFMWLQRVQYAMVSVIWVRSWNCGCLVTWFCYQLIAKPGNKTVVVPWPDPYTHGSKMDFECKNRCSLISTHQKLIHMVYTNINLILWKAQIEWSWPTTAMCHVKIYTCSLCRLCFHNLILGSSCPSLV